MKINKQILGMMSVLSVMVLFCGCGCGGSDKKLEEKLSEADEYITNEDYEGAISAYRQAIEINDKSEAAYIGLIDAYIAIKDYDAAESVVDEAVGMAMLETESIKAKSELVSNLKTYVFGKDVVVGDVVSFGIYEQDNNVYNEEEDVEWRVLDIEDGYAFVLSEKCLDARPYNDEYVAVTWDSSTIRKWLNTEFFDKLLTEEEQGYVKLSHIITQGNSKYQTLGGAQSDDNVFLLSVEEVELYLKDKLDRIAQTTPHAIANGGYASEDNTAWWWLRTPGEKQSDAVNVYTDGEIMKDGYYVSNKIFSVRPAMWVKIKR
ncbi:MAG: tetratricopeptide repeat protein [Lachnospiraceae bacterium]|nr:tetratricopeptide repeat protein [Lachnospiraceae bacterium]